MGAGRKTQTFTMGERLEHPLSVNGSVTARNLTEDKFGSVIFGCTHCTMEECLREKLFGLPASHFSYVKNIKPGLPLFLFNYGDRKLHGIFEAASNGQMRINQYGWSADGSETRYPAQVRIHIRKKCQPLSEEQYKPILANNYYGEDHHFWFELDHAQTRAFLSLFEKRPLSTVSTYKPPFRRTVQEAFNDVDGVHETSKSSPKPASLRSGVTWVSLFKENPDVDGRTECETVKSSTAQADCPHLDFDETSTGSGSTVSCWDDENEDTQIPETHSQKNSLETEEERIYQRLKQIALCRKSLSTSAEVYIKEASIPCVVTEKQLVDDKPPARMEVAENASIASKFLFVINQLRCEMAEQKALSMDQSRKTKALELELACSAIELQQLRGRVNLLESGLKAAYNDERLGPYDCGTQTEQFDEQQLGTNEMVYIMGGCSGDNSWLSSVDRYSTSRDVVTCLRPSGFTRSYSSAAVSNGYIFNFGGCADVNGNLWYDAVECYNPWSNMWTLCSPLSEKKGGLASATFHNKIFVFGGANGGGCLSKVEMFDPALERWIQTQSLLQERAAPAAAELNGVLYVAGGYDGDSFLKSAERFDPREVSWSRLPGMNSSRASHSIAVLNEKLYALGGFDGTKMLASIEIFDPRMGSWVVADEMKESRAYCFAPVIGETIYTIGGMKQHGAYADKVQCYKEGHGWSVTNLKGIGKRSFFAATLH